MQHDGLPWWWRFKWLRIPVRWFIWTRRYRKYALERDAERLSWECPISDRPVVISGTYDEFHDWCEREGIPPGNAFHAGEAYSHRWLHHLLYYPGPFRIVRCGRWWCNPMSRDPVIRALEA